jgi:hypothetical protein
METHIVQVTECIDVEYISETWSKAQVLEETGEHVPGVPLKNEVKTLLISRGIQLT